MPRFFKRWALNSIFARRRDGLNGNSTNTRKLASKIVQVPPNGFRNGDLGDDESSYSTKESV